MIGQRRCISFRRNHLITAKDRRAGQSANVLRDACCIAIDPRTERNNQRGHHDLIRQTPLRKRQAGRTGAENHGESYDREQRTELVVGETAGSQEPDGAVGLFGER